ncbi:MAG: GNAT family N-acetyltransferase [Planctomycetota bacterium]
MLRFEEPHAALQDSYRDLIREFRDANEPLVPFPLSFPNEDFSAFLTRLAGCAQGVGIPSGFVSHSTYWLVSDGEVVGVSNLRHALTDALRHEGGSIGYGIRPSARGRGFAKEILRQTLIRARELGLTEVWLTCDQTNLASICTILSQGGLFISEELLEDRQDIVRRYRIVIDLNSESR